MSYNKIRSIQIDKKANKVIVSSACNNSKPLHYFKQEWMEYSHALQFGGMERLERVILVDYYKGLIQQGSNDYEKAERLFRFRNPDVTWNKIGNMIGEPLRYSEWLAEYCWEEVADLLYASLQDWRDRKPCPCVIEYREGWYVTRKNSQSVYYNPEIKNALTFKTREDAELFLLSLGKHGRGRNIVNLSEVIQ